MKELLEFLGVAEVESVQFRAALETFLIIDRSSPLGEKDLVALDSEFWEDAHSIIVQRFAKEGINALVRVFGTCTTIEIFLPNIEAAITGDWRHITDVPRLMALVLAHLFHDRCDKCAKKIEGCLFIDALLTHPLLSGS